MNNLDLIGIIIEGGAVGVLILVVILNYKKDKMYNKTMNNHLVHSGEVMKSFEIALNKIEEIMRQGNEDRKNMTSVLDRNARTTGDLIKTQAEMKGFIRGRK